jgi:hypothetical protein
VGRLEKRLLDGSWVLRATRGSGQNMPAGCLRVKLKYLEEETGEWRAEWFVLPLTVYNALLRMRIKDDA